MRSTFIVALVGSASAQLSKGGRATTDPVYSCQAPFTLVGKECVNTITQQPRYQCVQGILQGTECVTETPKQARCPLGTTPQGKQCITQVQTPAQPVCPPGLQNTGFACEAQQQLPLIEICEIGSREGPQCAVTDLAPYNVQQFCPPGFEEHAKGGCWRTTTYDCTPLATGKGAAGLRGLIGKEAGSHAPVNPKAAVIKQTCERKESAPLVAQKSCPPEYLDTGSGCVLKTYLPTTTRCSNGGPIETCFTVTTAPFDYECPPGTQQTGQTCIAAQAHPEETFCVQGFDNGLTCVTAVPAQLVCDYGLALTGGVCIGQETAPPQVTVTTTCTGKNCFAH